MDQGTLNNLVEEVTTKEAAEILGVSKDTVLRLKKAGHLEYRDAATPGSSRSTFRFPLTSVLKIRTSYTTDIPPGKFRREENRHPSKSRNKTKYIRVSDD